MVALSFFIHQLVLSETKGQGKGCRVPSVGDTALLCMSQANSMNSCYQRTCGSPWGLKGFRGGLTRKAKGDVIRWYGKAQNR